MKLKKIELTEDEKEYIKTYINDNDTAQAAFHEASLICKTSRKRLWDALGRLYPDAMDKTTTFNHKDGFIRYMEN